MKAWLVVNAFLTTEKFKELYRMFSVAASRQKIDLQIMTNADILPVLGEKETFEDVSFVLFWDKDVRLAKILESKGMLVANSAETIAVCDDKAMTHIYLERAGIAMPKTMVAPMTYENIGYTNLDFLERAEKKLGLPMIVKECFGSFGQQVYLVHSREELLNCVKRLAGRPFLLQEFIESSKGRDIRLQVVGDCVVAAMYRYSETEDFRANISNGGKMKAYEPKEEEKQLAVKACQAVGADFAGVDILFGETKPLICEINSNAHFKNIFDCTGINTANYIMEYLKKAAERKEEKLK